PPSSRKGADLVAGGGFEPPTSGLCLLLQLSLPGEPVRSLDFPFTLGQTVRVPHIKSLHVLFGITHPQELRSGLPRQRLPRICEVFTQKFPPVQPIVKSSPKRRDLRRIWVFADACRPRLSEFHFRSR